MEFVRVGLVVGTESEYGRRVLRGVRRFAREAGRPWLFWLTSHRRPDYAGLRGWDAAGVIAHLTGRDMADRLEKPPRPLVNVAFILDPPAPPHVGNDDAALGRAAAEHLRERQFRRFAYAGWPGLRYSDLREAGFAAAVRGFGAACSAFRDRPHPEAVPGPGSRAARARLRDWVATLPAPVGVMACNDLRAWEVLEACRELGRAVPEEVAVVGVDDDETFCLMAHPPLSSVATAAEQVGYLAADRLDTLMAGRAVVAWTGVPPARVAARHSTDTLAIDDPVVAEAVRFIRAHSARPLRVPDVLDAVAVSRRALERAFRKALGHAPADEIRAAHVRRACDLLATTELGMAEVARRSGFAEPKQLSTVFRRATGQTPTAFRAGVRPGPPEDGRIGNRLASD